MDKKQALKILNFDSMPTLEQARAAYRALAKKYHPDRAGSTHRNILLCEEKMKQLNAAFRLLRPHLKSKPETADRKTGTIRSSKPSVREKTKTNAASVKAFFRGFFKTSPRAAQKTRQRKVQPQARNRPRKNNVVSFKDRLRQAAVDQRSVTGGPGGGVLNPAQKRKQFSTSAHRRYQDYLKIRKQVKRRLARTSGNMGIQRVEKISRVQPVSRIADD